MSRNGKLWGLALTAALEIVHHDEISITLHGSTSIRYHEDAVALLREIIYDTLSHGLSFKAPKVLTDVLTDGPNQDTLGESETITEKE